MTRTGVVRHKGGGIGEHNKNTRMGIIRHKGGGLG